MNANTKKWLYGLGSAVIGGGASAIVSGLTSMGVAPDKFNFQSLHGFLDLLATVVANFIVVGIMSAAFYLKQSPLPPETLTQTVDTASVMQDFEGKIVSKVSSTVTTTPVNPADATKS